MPTKGKKQTNGKQLPDKVSGFVYQPRTGKPASGVRVSATIEYASGDSVSLGTLKTDTRGYVSFALGSQKKDSARHLWIKSMVSGKAVDVLALPLSPDNVADFLLEGTTGQTSTTDKQPLDPRASYQQEDYRDWKRSPESFTRSPQMILGEGDCQVPVPNTHGEHEYQMSFLMRDPLPSKFGANEPPAWFKQAGVNNDLKDIKKSLINFPAIYPNQGMKLSDNSPLLYGKIVRFKQVWQPLGQSLGNIVYSLPLAPCESVNIAVIDWSRIDAAERREGIESKEQLQHALKRDRTIDEIVTTSMTEHQAGVSAMGGASGLAGPVLLAGGVGGSYSFGNRNISANSTQQLSDLIAQAATSYRSLNSTVVVQATQSETDAIETRTVTNHNRNHALTIQYYEVLRHFAVNTAYVETIPVILLPYKLIQFNEETTLKYRQQLEQMLLDQRLRVNFDACARLKYCPDQYPEPEEIPAVSEPSAPVVEPNKIESYFLEIKTGDESWSGSGGEVTVYIKTNDGVKHFLHKIYEDSDDLERSGIRTVNISNANTIDAIGLEPGKISHIIVKFVPHGAAAGWKFKWLTVSYRLPGQNAVTLYDREVNQWLEDTVEKSFPVDTISVDDIVGIEEDADDEETGVSPPEPVVYNKKDDECACKMLIGHLNENQMYYNRAIWLLQDPDERRIDLTQQLIGTPLIDEIQMTPLEVWGNYVAFQIGDTYQEKSPNSETTKTVTLPGRGVFAETHLSHCPAAEKRDPSRDRGPEEVCCNQAPDITGVQPGSRQVSPDLTPSDLPNPVVNIQNAPNAPDPTGLASALGVLGTPEIFRDMSLGSEVAGLVSGLASGMVSLEQARIAARNIKNRQNAGARGGAGGIGSAVNTATHPSRTRNAREQNDFREAVEASNLPRAVKNRILENYFDSGSVHEPVSSPASSNIQQAGLWDKGNPQLPENIEQWKDVFLYRVPEVIALDTLTPRNIVVQTFSFATGDPFGIVEPAINLDMYKVKVIEMPKKQNGDTYQMKELFDEIRLNMSDIISSFNIEDNPHTYSFISKVLFSSGIYPEVGAIGYLISHLVSIVGYTTLDPYDEGFDKALWESADPVGAVMQFNNAMDDMGVVAGRHTDDHWMFSTVRDSRVPLLGDVGTHPVSGNRKFGYFKGEDDLFQIYTQGADRTTGLSETGLDFLTFFFGHVIWLSWQAGIKDFIQSRNGSAEILSPFSDRFEFNKVVQHFESI